MLDNVVYHGSQKRMTNIEGRETGDRRFGVEGVFVSSFKYIAAHFLFNSKVLYTEITRRYPNIKKARLARIGWGYEFFGAKFKRCLANEIATTYPNHSAVDVALVDVNQKPIFFHSFVCDFTGYVHYINYEEYKGLMVCDDDNMFESMIKGNVKPFKVDKLTVKFTVRNFVGKMDSFCLR